MDEDHRLLPQEPLPRRRAHARAGSICRGGVESGAHGENRVAEPAFIEEITKMRGCGIKTGAFFSSLLGPKIREFSHGQRLDNGSCFPR